MAARSAADGHEERGITIGLGGNEVEHGSTDGVARRTLTGGRLRIISGRSSLAALVSDAAGIEVVRGWREPAGDVGWLLDAGDERSVAASLGYPVASAVDRRALVDLRRTMLAPLDAPRPEWQGIGADERKPLANGGKSRPALVDDLLATYGSARAVCEAAARGERLSGCKAPQLALLRAAAERGGAGVLRALALAGTRDDAPLDVAAILGGMEARDGVLGERHGEASAEAGAQPDDGGVSGGSEEGRAAGRAVDRAAGEGDRGHRGEAAPRAQTSEEREPAPGVLEAAASGQAHAPEAVAPPETATPGPREERPMTDTSQQNRSRNPKAERADRITHIFRARYRELAGLFPRDGETMVNRARLTAVQVSMGMGQNVTAESIAEAAIACHHLGLEVGDQAYIYPYGPTAKLTVGPRGLIALASRSGEVKSIKACSVFKGDDFVYDLGDDSIHHVKALSGRRPAKVHPEYLITHTWAKIITRQDGPILEVLTAEDIAFYRSFSKATSGPWFDNYEGMCRKTALKRVLEYVPRSPLLAAALREQEDSTYEIPEEIMEAMRSRQANGKATAQPEPEPQPAQEEPAATDDGAAAQGARR